MIIRINEIVNQTLLIYSTLIIYLRVRLLLNYKFSLLHEKGELVNPMHIRKSGFLNDA